MVKLIAFLKARAGMSRADFIDHYEHRHVPLIKSIAPQIAFYTRNYLELPPMRDDGDSAAWDVVTELGFEDPESFDAAMLALAARRNDIRADEARFLNIDAIRLYRVNAPPGP